MRENYRNHGFIKRLLHNMLVNIKPAIFGAAVLFLGLFLPACLYSGTLWLGVWMVSVIAKTADFAVVIGKRNDPVKENKNPYSPSGDGNEGNSK